MTYEHIQVVRQGGVEHLTLARPAVRNAFNDEMIAELTAWAERASADRSIRAAVLGGAGPTFCAGADLTWMAKTVEYTESQNVDDALAASRMFAAIDALPFPVVGRIHGAALGGGAGLAAVCDIVIAADDVVFGFTEVKLGIIPAVISPFVLAKIGRSAARELFLTGRRFSAQHAQEIGLVHSVVREEDLGGAVDAVLREVLAAGPEAVTAVKGLIATLGSLPSAEHAGATARALAARRVSPEGQEGLRAFLEKRRPSWSGA